MKLHAHARLDWRVAAAAVLVTSAAHLRVILDPARITPQTTHSPDMVHVFVVCL